jgi:MFS family permease
VDSSPADRRLVRTLVVVTGVAGIVSSLGAPLVPSIAAHFDVAVTTASWSLTATLLAGAVAVPVLGRLGTGTRRRPAVITVAGAVTLGTLLSVAAVVWGSDGFALLVVGRVLQGLGLGVVPLAVGVARDALTGETLQRAVAAVSVTVVAGAGIGYPVTAVAAEVGGLAAAYGTGTVLAVVACVVGWRGVPRGTRTPPSPVDWAGGVLLGGGLALTLVALTQGETWGWSAPRTVTFGAAGLLLLAAWVARSLRHPAPLVDLRLATREGVAGPHLVALVAGVGMFALITSAVLVVQADEPGFGLGRSVLAAGLLLVPFSLTSIAGTRLARAVASRWGTASLLPTGCTVYLAATILLAVSHDDLATVLVVMAVGGVGSGFTFASLPVLIVPLVPAAEASSAIAFNQVLRALGFTVGSAVSVALTAAYGGGTEGFRAALLTIATVWVVAGVGAWWLDRRTPPPGAVTY